MTMRAVTICVALGLSLTGTSLVAQPTKLPSPEEIQALQTTYRTERDRIIKAGLNTGFLPAIMNKADELAKKSAGALAAGRLIQANDAIRQARWQLPYRPTGSPDHIARIIGNPRLRHRGKINAVAYSPDGQKIATASDDKTVKLWDLGNGHEVLSFAGHDDKVGSLAWTPDGKTILSGADKSIQIWNAVTGKGELSIPADGQFVNAIALSRDGKRLFTGQTGVAGKGTTNGLFVYDIKTGKLVREVMDFTNSIGALCVNPEGNILAAGDENGNIRLFQYPRFADNDKEPDYWTQQDLHSPTRHLCFSPDGKTLARVAYEGVKLYATPLPGAPFQVAMPRLTINTFGARAAVFSKDGKTLYSGGLDGTITAWDSETGEKVGEFKNAHALGIHGLALSGAGNQLASCGADHAVRLWDLEPNQPARDFEGHAGPVWTAAFSPDGTKIVSASADKTVKVWQRDTGKVLFTLTDHQAPVTVAQFSPDGKRIASAGGDKIIRLFDAANGKPLRTCEGHQGTITFLEFSRDSQRIVSGGADRRIKIWDADTGKEIVPIDDNSSVVAGVAFSPDGKQIAVANIDQTIRLYDAVTGKMQHHWVAHGAAVNGVAYSPNGQLLASCGADAAVQIWPLATPGTNAIRLDGHTGSVSMVAFHNDSRHLASCGADQLIKLWKIDGNVPRELQAFRGHKDWVTSVAFSKDGHYLVSGSVDRKVKIWEITSREIPVLSEHASYVGTIAVSPDGKTIASGSRDRTIKLWDRATGAEIASLDCSPAHPQSLAFTPDGKRLIGSVLQVTDKYEASVRMWDVAPPREITRTPQQINAFGRLRGYSPYLALDPTGDTAFVWQHVGDVKVDSIIEAFNLEKGTSSFTFTEDNRKLNSVAFCANGQLAATGAKDGSIRLWEMKKTSANIAPGGDWFLFDKVELGDIALTPDGKILIASSNQGDIKIAKIAGRTVLKTIKGHDGSVQACMTSADGKRFATAGADSVVKLWDTQTGEELRRWDLGKQPEPLVVNLAFTPDGRQLVTANADTTVYVLELP